MSAVTRVTKQTLVKSLQLSLSDASFTPTRAKKCLYSASHWGGGSLLRPSSFKVAKTKGRR